MNTWGGAGHASKARTLIHPDGSVEMELGSQDLGTGTRTIIAMVAAETLGLPMSMIKVKIGDNTLSSIRALRAVPPRSAAFLRPPAKRR